MNAAMVLLIVLVGARAIPQPDDMKADDMKADWEAYKLKYGKNYSPDQDIWRLNLYERAKQLVEAQNNLYDNHLSSFNVEINQFADMRDDEIL